MKFGQLNKYSMRTIFLEKSFLKCGGETIPRLPDPFLKNQNCAYLWINSLKFHTACFYCVPSGGLSNYIKTKLQTTSFYLYGAFLKNEKRSGTSLSALFSA